MPTKLALLLLLLTTPALSQTFDTVSIHPNLSGRPNGIIAMGPQSDRLAITNVPLSRILAFAFNFRREQLLIGLPDWSRTERFDLLAKVAPSDLPAYQALTNNQRRALLQSILADRFALKSHLESRPLPAYALTVAKSSPKLRPASNKPRDPVPGPDGKPTEEDDFATAPGHFVAHAVPMQSLALALSTTPGMDRDVLDQTNLPGPYDFTLTWTPDPTPDSEMPSLFTALQEQLGLKLVPTTAPIQVLVVSTLTRPTPN